MSYCHLAREATLLCRLWCRHYSIAFAVVLLDLDLALLHQNVEVGRARRGRALAPPRVGQHIAVARRCFLAAAAPSSTAVAFAVAAAPSSIVRAAPPSAAVHRNVYRHVYRHVLLHLLHLELDLASHLRAIRVLDIPQRLGRHIVVPIQQCLAH